MTLAATYAGTVVLGKSGLAKLYILLEADKDKA